MLCGVGFIANLNGKPAAILLPKGLRILKNSSIEARVVYDPIRERTEHLDSNTA